MASLINRNTARIINDPPLARFLFSNTRAALLWLPIRVLLGFAWIDAASHKIGVPGWTENGEALKGFWENAIRIPEQGRPPIAFDWYRDFIQSLLDAGAYTWFAKLVAYGELFIGIGLIIGAFVGLAAFCGAFMNFNFIMAGAASTNGLLIVGAILLILAWKVAGYIGADYYLLNWLGTPWGRAVDEKATAPVGAIPVGAGD